MPENMDQNNSEGGQFLRIAGFTFDHHSTDKPINFYLTRHVFEHNV